MSKVLNQIEEKFLVLNLLFSTIIVFLNVVLRYCFHNSLHWVDELARYLFIWLIWLGADFAFHERRHLRIDMLSAALKGKPKLILELFVHIAWFGFCCFLGYQGFKLVSTVVAQDQLSTSMQINMGWAYACVPLGGTFMAIRLIFDIKDMLLTGKIPGEDKK